MHFLQDQVVSQLRWNSVFSLHPYPQVGAEKARVCEPTLGEISQLPALAVCFPLVDQKLWKDGKFS